MLCNQLIRGSFLKSKDVHKGIYADVVHKSLVDEASVKTILGAKIFTLSHSQAIVGPDMQSSWVTVAVKNDPGRKGARPGSSIRISFSVLDIERPE